MTYSESGYLSRAEECVRLANATKDEMLRSAILGLRQQYLHIAKRLSEMDGALRGAEPKAARATQRA